MKRGKLITMASALLILSLIVGYMGYSFGENLFERDFLVLFGLTIVFILLALFSKPEQTEWTCEKCKTKLVRKQIKFGLCPKCGMKVEGFRGESPYSWV